MQMLDIFLLKQCNQNTGTIQKSRGLWHSLNLKIQFSFGPTGSEVCMTPGNKTLLVFFEFVGNWGLVIWSIIKFLFLFPLLSSENLFVRLVCIFTMLSCCSKRSDANANWVYYINIKLEKAGHCVKNVTQIRFLLRRQVPSGDKNNIHILHIKWIERC